MLSVIAIVAIVGGVVLFSQRADDTTTGSNGVLSVPDLPIPVRDDPAPNFAVDLIGGGKFVLDDHLAGDGRPVFLNLWASWCLPCRAEMPAIDAASQTHVGVKFLGIAVKDDPRAAEDFALEIGVSYRLAIDETERISELYPTFGLPATFLISSEGRIVAVVQGEVIEAQIDGLIASSFYG